MRSSIWWMTCALAVFVVALLPTTASAESAPAGGHDAAAADDGPAVDPIQEFAVNRFGPELKIGPIDMSITKPVIYLWLAVAICGLWAWYMSRRLAPKPDRKQTLTETLYEFGHDQIARASLGEKTFVRYMPFVASLFFFIWVANIVSFVPLPVSAHPVDVLPGDGTFELPAFQIYAAMSNLNVTLILTLVVIAFSAFEGIRNNGFVGYLKSWVPPGVPGWLAPAIWALEGLGRVLRIVSLSVRLFANLLAGHLLIGMMLAMIIILGVTVGATASLIMLVSLLVIGAWIWSRGKRTLALFFGVLAALIPLSWAVNGWDLAAYPVASIGTVPIALGFYLFEVGLVISLQAYIFALLAGIYIGTEAEPAH